MHDSLTDGLALVSLVLDYFLEVSIHFLPFVCLALATHDMLVLVERGPR